MKSYDKFWIILGVLTLSSMFLIGTLFVVTTLNRYPDIDKVSYVVKEVEPIIQEPVAKEYASYYEYLENEPVVESAEFKVTYYCGCSKCCGKWSEGSESEAHGCNGDKLIPFVSIATDPDIIPYGTELWDDEGNHYMAMDTGSGVDGYHIDLFTGNHNEALKLGVNNITLYWDSEQK